MCHINALLTALKKEELKGKILITDSGDELIQGLDSVQTKTLMQMISGGELHLVIATNVGILRSSIGDLVIGIKNATNHIVQTHSGDQSIINFDLATKRMKLKLGGDKIGIFAGFVSFLFSGDDIIKGLKYMDEAGDAGKNIGKNLDGDILTDGSHLIRNSKGKVTGLKPNTTFKAGENGYIYKTDADGFVIEAYASELKLFNLDRIPHNPKTVGKLEVDHA